MRRGRLTGLLVAVAATVSLGLAVGCGGDNDSTAETGGANAESRGDIKILYVSHGQAADEFHTIVKRGVDDAAKELGVDARWQGLETFDTAKLAQNIDAAIASKPDGLVISNIDPSVIGPKIKKAAEAGIPVVVSSSADDQDPTTAKYALAWVGSDEHKAGRLAGERMREAGVTNALCVNPEVGSVQLDIRCDSFAEGLGGKSKVLAVDLNDPTAIEQRVEATLREGDYDGIMTLWAQGSDSVRAAVEKVGMEDDVTVATFDMHPESLQAVADGEMEFAIDQQPYLRGYLPVLFLTQYVEYGVSPVGPVATGPLFITKENAARTIELSKEGLR